MQNDFSAKAQLVSLTEEKKDVKTVNLTGSPVTSEGKCFFGIRP